VLTVTAPAKINLTLEVLGRRPDGYHQVRSVLQTVSLCDTLSFQPSRRVTFRSGMSGWSPEASLITKAVGLLREATGRSQGADIEVEKHIPLLAGLGGDSSDAAATLRGLNELWGLNLSRERLLDLAARLGSDVAFFISGGTALAEGRGVKLTPLPSPPSMWVVLVVPDVPREAGKTGHMYAALKPAHYTDGRITENFVKALKEGRAFKPTVLFNTFENIAFDSASELKVYKEHFLKLGAVHVHLAGSGPALFTLLEDKARAEDLYHRCKNQGMEAYLAQTL
jgi:4-diphosphocytidyl-2-C-methyl-D-erythritol kinase